MSFILFTSQCYTQSAVLLWQVVCLPATLVDCDYKGWKFSNIISRLFSLGCLLSADPGHRGTLQEEHREILAGIWERCGKNCFRCTYVISL